MFFKSLQVLSVFRLFLDVFECLIYPNHRGYLPPGVPGRPDVRTSGPASGHPDVRTSRSTSTRPNVRTARRPNGHTRGKKTAPPKAPTNFFGDHGRPLRCHHGRSGARSPTQPKTNERKQNKQNCCGVTKVFCTSYIQKRCTLINKSKNL